MKFDQNLMFSDGQSLLQAAGSYLSDKSITASPAGTPAIGGPLQSDFGRVDTDLDIAIVVTTAFTTAAGATLQIQVVQTDDAALTANLEVLRESRVIAVAAFVKGAIFRLGPVPSMTRVNLGLRYVIGTGATTAGVVTAGLAYGVPSNSFNLIG